MRLSPEAIRSLMNETNASALIVTNRSRAMAQGALLKRTRIFSSISFDEFMRSAPAEDVWASQKGLVREDDRNVIILHSSGTTGQ